MKKSIVFSIIIPIRKPNAYLKETLEKLKKQSFKQFEVLVITDKISKTSNPAAKRNLGAKMAKGEYLAFLDDDSYPYSNWLKNTHKILNKYPKLSAVCGPCLTPPTDNFFQQASGLVWSSYLGSGGAGTYRNKISPKRFVNDFPTVNLIVNKKDFNTIGGFDTSHWPGEDTLLCLDLTHKLKKQILYHPSIIVYHHRRSVVIKHLHQITRYAIHRGHFARVFPQTSLLPGYLAPSFFTLYIIVLLTINIININLSIPSILINLPLFSYLFLLLLTVIQFIFEKHSILLSLTAVVTIPLTHLYYGLLFMYGFFLKKLDFKPHEYNKKDGSYIGG